MSAKGTRRPTPEQLAQAEGVTVPDIVGPNLRVLFCGINPSLWSGAVGRHFAHPGNRFWKAIACAGFTDGLLTPADDRKLLEGGIGITNLVDGATRSAKDLGRSELEEGARRLGAKVRSLCPGAVAFLGVGAYRSGFRRPQAKIGRQRETIAGIALWVIPNPSGLQAHYPFERLVSELRQLHESLDDE
jgi:TDG/mug DNA glycosylase family protein